MKKRAVVTAPVSNPVSARWRLRKLRMKSAAPTSRTMETATSATTSVLRARLRALPSPVRPPSRSARDKLPRAACAAGANPNTIPVAALTRTV